MSSPGNSDVEVYLRVRPSSSPSCLSSGTPTSVVAGRGRTAAAFTFDKVLDGGSTQAQVFREVGAGMVQACLVGFNTTIFACESCFLENHVADWCLVLLFGALLLLESPLAHAVASADD